MNIPSTTPVGLFGLSPEKMLSSPALSESQKIDEATRQFEAVLMRKILGDAHKPLFKGGLFSGDSTTAIYQDMFVAQLADSIVHAHSFGLAASLKQQLTPKEPAPNSGAQPESECSFQ